VLFDKIKDLQISNSEEHNKVIEKIESIEKKIDNRIGEIDKKVEDVLKFRWLLAGALVIVSFVLSQSSTVIDILTPSTPQVQVEKNK
jgi:tetrahydromethanopterin S-methyltransferase subunit G